MEWKIEDELGSRTLQSPDEISVAVQKIMHSNGDYDFMVLSPSEPINALKFIQVCPGDGALRLEISVCQGGTKSHMYSREFPPDVIVYIMTTVLNGTMPDLRGWTFEGEFGE